MGTSQRVEHWQFPDGRTASRPVMCAHEIRGGKIAGWHEYWNPPALLSQLPESWFAGFGG